MYAIEDNVKSLKEAMELEDYKKKIIEKVGQEEYNKKLETLKKLEIKEEKEG
jgi:hypothetical protein